MLPENACHCEPVVLRAANQNLNDCQWQSYLNVAQTGVALSKDSLRSQSVPQRLPLLIKGSCHEVTEGIRTSGFPRTLCECNFTIPQSRACVRRASQLPLHKGAGGAPAPVRSPKAFISCCDLTIPQSASLTAPPEWEPRRNGVPHSTGSQGHPLFRRTKKWAAIGHPRYYPIEKITPASAGRNCPGPAEGR